LTMNKDLGITSQQYGFLAGIFFIGYFIFEIPSNLLLQRVGARVWIARILLSWGVVAVLTGFAENIFQLYVLRFLLGVAEAGFFPGIILYFTYWFPRREQARAVACFMAANPIGNLVGAPLSGLILDHAHWAGMSSWRWLLVLEGVPAGGRRAHVFASSQWTRGSDISACGGKSLALGGVSTGPPVAGRRAGNERA